MSDDAKKRADLIQHIRKAPTFLDAVFLIYSYRRKAMYWGGLPEITPDEVFAAYDATEYDDCLKRSMALLAMSPRIGESAFNYAGAMPYEQALQEMKDQHPGFSAECYGEVLMKGMFEMR